MEDMLNVGAAAEEEEQELADAQVEAELERADSHSHLSDQKSEQKSDIVQDEYGEILNDNIKNNEFEDSKEDIISAMHKLISEEESSVYTVTCNANIYNAFLIANYRKDLHKKDLDFVGSDFKYGLGFLAYLTAFVQWIALLTMVTALMTETMVTLDLETDKVLVWTAWPSSWYSVLIWPFFMIGLMSTYKQFSQILVDIHILELWGITARKRYHLFFLKFICELVLYTFGSFLFYVALSWYSKADVDFLDVILKLLAYQYIFSTDEWAYQLVQDIVRRRLMPKHCNTFLQGKRIGNITKFEMTTFITIPFSVSLIIQGIYSTSYVIFVSGILSCVIWSLDVIETKCSKQKRKFY